MVLKIGCFLRTASDACCPPASSPALSVVVLARKIFPHPRLPEAGCNVGSCHEDPFAGCPLSCVSQGGLQSSADDPLQATATDVQCGLGRVVQLSVPLARQICWRIWGRLFAEGEEIIKLKTAQNVINENT